MEKNQMMRYIAIRILPFCVLLLVIFFWHRFGNHTDKMGADFLVIYLLLALIFIFYTFLCIELAIRVLKKKPFWYINLIIMALLLIPTLLFLGIVGF